MGRPARAAQGGLVYHTLNRANARLAILHDDGDFAAFERILSEAVTRFDMRLLAYCLMPNHFHLPLWPRGDGDLSQFMQWLTPTHTQRWHAHHHTAGSGHLYQGRFKSFPGLEKGSGTVAGTARRVLRTTVPDPFSSYRLPLRRAKRAARRLDGPGRGLAMAKPVV
jgi:REP element-mobilizing transposase RayT